MYKACFKRRILHVPNAIQTVHNEKANYLLFELHSVHAKFDV